MPIQFALVASSISGHRPLAVGQLRSPGQPLTDRTPDEIQAEIEETLSRMRAQNLALLREHGPSAVLRLD